MIQHKKNQESLGHMLQNGEACPFLVQSMWYVMQTEAGREQELVEKIKKMVEHRVYRRCFFVKRERVRKVQGEYKVYTEALYPGYVFIDTDAPEKFYTQIRELPQFGRILGKGEKGLYPVDEEEREFLTELVDGDEEDTIRLSPVKVNEEGEIVACGGVVRKFLGSVVKKRMRERYVVVRVEGNGKVREVLVGVWKE